MSQEKAVCSRCHGTGSIPCPACGGSGKLQNLREHVEKEKRVQSCAACHGSGKKTCGVCGGSGKK